MELIQGGRSVEQISQSPSNQIRKCMVQMHQMVEQL